MTYINEKNLEKTKLLIRKATPPIIVESQNNEYNRKLLEYGKFQALVLTPKEGRDKPKALDSGLNHVLAKIASKNSIAICFDFERIPQLDKETKAKTLSRIAQNIKICRKANTNLGLINTPSKNILSALGASSVQIKKAIVF